MKTYMVQCTLRNSGSEHVAWIPEQFAKAGKLIKLQRDGEWTDGWKVEHVGNKIGVEECLERRNDYRKQRKSSDV